MTDATTDRRVLTEVEYADSTKLRSRQSIYDFRSPAGEWWSWVLDHAEWPEGAVVLDVGCGPGNYLQRVRGVGIDLSEGMAREAKQHAPTSVGDVCALPVRAASIDRLLAPHMLYHAPDLDAAASELARVLRPGGVALVVTNDSSHMGHMIEQLSGVLGSDAVMRFIDRFNLDNGGALLERHFDRVTLDRWIGELAVPDAEPVVRYADSCRPLYETQLTGGQTWEEMMRGFQALVEQDISATGAWRCVTHSGVFVCR
ncbi:MAG TPA: class I SAM-dependent methyltransferase [Acidimicrobiales bacterium]|nr:class I SAM-dependent methyltransferase [Acidimicrobiales bacterium]